MTLRDKLRFMMRDYTVSDILYALSLIFKEDAKSFRESNELISASENYIISDALNTAGSKIAYMPKYGISSTPEPVSETYIRKIVEKQGAENEDFGSGSSITRIKG